MGVQQKLGAFLFQLSMFLLVSASQEHKKAKGRHSSKKDHNIKKLAVLLATAGAIMSIKSFNNSFSNNHQRLGVALYCIIWLQVLVGIFRPQRGSKKRSLWFFAHRVVGTAVSLLGVLNVFIGLQAYQEKTSKSITTWNILFTVQISLIVIFYLLQ
ncbi:cytochrome b561 domain-containing protein At4g18260-like [Glycine soja]|uniref:cytochrome b561 domain-containing protein At4g18260-like n=1 Tax=Glycine soja TaxID=3848 RepID=UPI001040DDE3|nr:cytochrome b561 domain-containing protein At4g18260-like [Glycine soja]